MQVRFIAFIEQVILAVAAALMVLVLCMQKISESVELKTEGAEDVSVSFRARCVKYVKLYGIFCSRN